MERKRADEKGKRKKKIVVLKKKNKRKGRGAAEIRMKGEIEKEVVEGNKRGEVKEDFGIKTGKWEREEKKR